MIFPSFSCFVRFLVIDTLWDIVTSFGLPFYLVKKDYMGPVRIVESYFFFFFLSNEQFNLNFVKKFYVVEVFDNPDIVMRPQA